MNSRLLTAVEKSLNARQRWRRNRVQKRRVRRHKVLENLVLGESATTVLTQKECFQMMFGHLHKAKHIANKAALRNAVMSWSDPEEPPIWRHGEGIIPRPTRLLRAKCRSNICPWIVSEKESEELLPVGAALEKASAYHRAGVPMYTVLDRFHSMTDMAWHEAAGLLYRPLGNWKADIDIIDAMAMAREFWRGVEIAKIVYRTAVSIGQCEPAVGEWGHFEADEAGAVMPGLRLPRELKRDRLLVRLIRKSGKLIAVDFHSITYRPLAQHPF